MQKKAFSKKYLIYNLYIYYCSTDCFADVPKRN